MELTTLGPLGLSEADIWRAVKTRDRRYDGRFVFGALSTHIYCRPSCPSRRPRRERVVVFLGPTEAEAAGFRACRRCKPNDDDVVDSRSELVRNACTYLEGHRDGKVTLNELAEAVGTSPFHVQRVFRKALGITPREYSERLHLMNARALLKDGQSVRRSTYSSGHSSAGWLYSRDRPKLGMRPGEYKDGGSGRTIVYATAKCSLGVVLIGSTEKGVCSVSLGKSDEELRRYLALEFPKAVLIPAEGELSPYVERVMQYIDGKPETDLADLPVDIRATSFQARVWKELQRIPYGRTSTYSEIARRIGSPLAARAVAKGCATNPIALVVPCHRAIRKDESLGGYRWGLERKAALLAKEAIRTEVPKSAVSSQRPRASLNKTESNVLDV